MAKKMATLYINEQISDVCEKNQSSQKYYVTGPKDP